jgi:hypothetical protein
MQIVIDIPEVFYEYCKAQDDAIEIQLAVKNGIPLPKGHGDLIDISNIDVIELEDSVHFIQHKKGDEVDVYISAPIIIKADRSV